MPIDVGGYFRWVGLQVGTFGSKLWMWFGVETSSHTGVWCQSVHCLAGNCSVSCGRTALCLVGSVVRSNAGVVCAWNALGGVLAWYCFECQESYGLMLPRHEVMVALKQRKKTWRCLDDCDNIYFWARRLLSEAKSETEIAIRDNIRNKIGTMDEIRQLGFDNINNVNTCDA